MKKFLIILVIIIILGGVGFYFGWVQINLDENEYGVVFTKTHGWDPSVTEPGVFTWRWEKLIPTNFTIHVFEILPKNTKVSSTGTLPSGDIYAEYLERDIDFTYEISLSFAFKLRPEFLPEMVEDENLTPENLDEWYQTVTGRCRQVAVSTLEKRISRSDDTGLIPQFSALEDAVSSQLESEFPRIEFLSLSVDSYIMPDIELYKTGRDLFLTEIRSRESVLARETVTLTTQKLREEKRLDTLREYGEILSQYPILLEFFSLGFDVDTPLPEGFLPSPGNSSSESDN